MVYFRIENTDVPGLIGRPRVLIAKKREDALDSINRIYKRGFTCSEIERSKAIEIMGKISVADAEKDSSGVVTILPPASRLKGADHGLR